MILGGLHILNRARIVKKLLVRLLGVHDTRFYRSGIPEDPLPGGAWGSTATQAIHANPEVVPGSADPDHSWSPRVAVMVGSSVRSRKTERKGNSRCRAVFDVEL